MLVDNAIVVIENIYRHLESGEDARTASSRGASEVGVAILASTLTTVAVFLPIVLFAGAGRQTLCGSGMDGCFFAVIIAGRGNDDDSDADIAHF